MGANEAAKAAGKIKDDFGIFAADATKPELSAMKKNEGVRMTVAVGGTLQNSADTVWGLIEQLESGKPIETKEVYRILVPVTKENVEEFLHPK